MRMQQWNERERIVRGAESMPEPAGEEDADGVNVARGSAAAKADAGRIVSMRKELSTSSVLHRNSYMQRVDDTATTKIDRLDAPSRIRRKSMENLQKSIAHSMTLHEEFKKSQKQKMMDVQEEQKRKKASAKEMNTVAQKKEYEDAVKAAQEYADSVFVGGHVFSAGGHADANLAAAEPDDGAHHVSSHRAAVRREFGTRTSLSVPEDDKGNALKKLLQNTAADALSKPWHEEDVMKQGVEKNDVPVEMPQPVRSPSGAISAPKRIQRDSRVTMTQLHAQHVADAVVAAPPKASSDPFMNTQNTAKPPTWAGSIRRKSEHGRESNGNKKGSAVKAGPGAPLVTFRKEDNRTSAMASRKTSSSQGSGSGAVTPKTIASPATSPDALLATDIAAQKTSFQRVADARESDRRRSSASGKSRRSGAYKSVRGGGVTAVSFSDEEKARKRPSSVLERLEVLENSPDQTVPEGLLEADEKTKIFAEVGNPPVEQEVSPGKESVKKMPQQSLHLHVRLNVKNLRGQHALLGAGGFDAWRSAGKQAEQVGVSVARFHARRKQGFHGKTLTTMRGGHHIMDNVIEDVTSFLPPHLEKQFVKKCVDEAVGEQSEAYRQMLGGVVRGSVRRNAPGPSRYGAGGRLGNDDYKKS